MDGAVMIRIPSAYTEGYARARAHNAPLADNYMQHTCIGDPVLDPVMAEIASLPTADLHRFIKAGINQEDGVLDKAPHTLREFFARAEAETPAWLDYAAFMPAARVFNVNVTNMLVAFVAGVLIEGFSTLIAKSFATTGRVLNEATAKRRLMQNNRHLMEVFFPGGLERQGDGFKLSLRLRLVHGRVRYLLAQSDTWNEEAYGTPISAAHLGLAMTVFSMRLLQFSRLVGTVFTPEEEASVMAVWRYSGYVMGVPESILFTDRDQARDVFQIGSLCEPPPDEDSAIMANALIEAIPGTAGVEDPKEQRLLRDLAYRMSRALIGRALADQLQFPKVTSFGALFGWRMKQRFTRLIKSKHAIKSENFMQLLDISAYDEGGPSYRLPDHVLSSKSNPW